MVVVVVVVVVVGVVVVVVVVVDRYRCTHTRHLTSSSPSIKFSS